METSTLTAPRTDWQDHAAMPCGSVLRACDGQVVHFGGGSEGITTGGGTGGIQLASGKDATRLSDAIQSLELPVAAIPGVLNTRSYGFAAQTPKGRALST